MVVLPSTILASTAILDRGSESVKAVLTAEENRFSRALTDLQRLSLEEKMPIAIVGGLGTIHYGYPAATQDIDIVVGRRDLGKLIKAAPHCNFVITWEAKSGWHNLKHGEVEINVVPEGAKTKNSAPTTIPGPSQLGVAKGLDYASLSGWIELKLSSARQKDRAHVVEVMKKTDDGSLRGARAHVGGVHESYLRLFDELLEQAREERSQEEERGAKR